MPTYALLLRGINVGANPLSMADLRATLEAIGCTAVTTYLRSGNAVVTSPETHRHRLTAQAEEALAARTGLATRVLARTGPELAEIIAANPFPEAVATPTLLHVLFLSAQPHPTDVAGLDPAAYAPDEFRLGTDAVYLRFAVGIGRSRLPPALGRHLARAHPDIVATARNWNTVRKLAELTG
jgi:uncharacterized protein (DUF1697 family)